MSSVIVLLFMFSFSVVVFSQGVGSGSNGNLRLCVVEGRGTYKRAARHCPILDDEKSGVECVLGTDRLDCLRRISKGTVDFGVFSPEDLIAAQWANVDVLVTNEMRSRTRPYERSIVAVANRRILPDGLTSLQAIMRNTTLCHPGVGVDDIRPLSDTLSGYLESLVLERSCDSKLTMTENRIKALADFFGKTCKAGPWVPDKSRDTELKRRYPSLCAACSAHCDINDPYWGDSGALACLVEVGDVTWAELDDVRRYFGLTPKEAHASADRFAYLCRDGTWQPLDGSEPCVWLHRPWPVIVAKRKASKAVSDLTSVLTNGDVLVDKNWHGALAALLEIHQGLPEPLSPSMSPMDYLAKAKGFREAYSQSGCDPPRHITLCTSSNLQNNKCQWLSEAGAVYGIVPPMQCSLRSDTEECLKAVHGGESDAVITGSDWLVRGMRDYSIAPILHEATPIVEKTSTVVALVLKNSGITDLKSLRGKRAFFPNYDGVAWHSALTYFMEKEKLSCTDMNTYFGDVCAPGIERYETRDDVKERYTKSCYKDGEKVIGGELKALQALIEGKADVAFISMATLNTYNAKQIQESWARDLKQVVPLCPEDNEKYCFISWSNIGHIMASTNTTMVRQQEIINMFTKLDQLFGKHYPFHSAMFSMYGPFNHQLDVLFHNNTKMLATDNMLKMHPYDKIPLNLERSLLNVKNSCQITDFEISFGAKTKPSLLFIILSLVVYFL